MKGIFIVALGLALAVVLVQLATGGPLWLECGEAVEGCR